MDTTAKSPLFIAGVALVADQILERFYVGLDPHVHWLLLNGGALLMAIVLVGEALECAQCVVLSLERCALSAIASRFHIRKALRRRRG
jgi:hypothetical protein